MGRPKAWLPFGDELLLPRIARILGDVVSPIVVVAAPGQDVPPLPSNVMVARDPEEGRGPLQGLAAGLTALNGVCDAVYFSSCDVPFLKSAFVRRMLDLLGGHDACVPRIDDYLQPLASVIRVRVAPIVERLLRDNRPRPAFLFDEVSTRIVRENELRDVDPAMMSLRNINTLAEYDAALRDHAAGAG
jgi:molybdopterin-guanine dinucleotide biosynthesis protein A